MQSAGKTIYGSSRNDDLEGTDKRDTIYGGAGNDKIQGEAGDDLLFGGTGNDLLRGGAGNDFLDGGDGTDTAILKGQFSDYSFERLEDSSVRIIDLRPGKNDVDIITNIEFVRFSDGTRALDEILPPNLNLIGTSGDDTLVGSSGGDTLQGLDGDDALMGGGGDDLLIGDAGTDTAVFTGDLSDYSIQKIDANTIAIVDLRAVGDGIDYLQGIENLQFADGTRLLDDVAPPADLSLLGTNGDDQLVGGAGRDVLQGLTGNDSLVGGAGDDWLDGGEGVDTMTGGDGNDTYVVDNAGDVVIEAIDDGYDTVRTTVTEYSLGATVENLLFTTNSNSIGIGNALSNDMTGGTGNDWLEGRDGDDILNGNSGDDTMIGGAGNDFYYVDAAGDAVIEFGGEGDDTVLHFGGSYELSGNVENMRFLDGTGNVGVGNALDNTLSGAIGVDQLSGGDGNDTLDGSYGADVLSGGADADVFVFSANDASVKTVTDFEAGNDIISLAGRGLQFSDLQITQDAASAMIIAGDTTIHVDMTGGTITEASFLF